MNITKIHPQGFCKGVINAIMITNNSLSNAKKPIYMLGNIVHNTNIADTYKEKGIIYINDLKDISSKEGSIIITAHGVSQHKYNLIQKTNLDIIDATCESVKKIQNIVREKIQNDYTVIYYGLKKHAECLSILEDYDSSMFCVVEGLEDVEKLNLTNKYLFFTNQTTMGYLDTLKIIAKLKEKYPYLIIEEDICSATKNRQLALINQSKDSDLIIVVGDKTSNNSISLVNISKNIIKKPCILIEKIDEIKNTISFIKENNYENIAITSGASTPKILVNNIENKLLDENFVIDIKNDDYIKIKR